MRYSRKTFTLFPKQERYVFSPARWSAYFGGYNNGKTTALCLRGLTHSLKFPNNRGVLIRRHAKDLRKTTRAEFFELLGCNEMTIGDHPLVARWSSQENLLRFKNGSEVFFLHLDTEDDLNNIASLNARWFGMDQAEEIVEAAWLTMLGRIGRIDIDPQTGGKLPPAWGSVVGNPSGHNWIWKHWKKGADGKGWKGKDYHLVEATTLDNPLASPDYVATLEEQYPAMWFKRYVLGSWDVASGRVYDEFDVSTHVIDHIDIKDGWKAGIGVDLGYMHPSAFIWVAVDYTGNWLVYDEHIASELLPHQHAKVVTKRGIRRENGDYLPIYGPHDAMNRLGDSGKNWQQLYRECGIHMFVGNKLKPVVRIQKIKKMLEVQNDVRHPFKDQWGAPRCFVFAGCEQLIDEFGLYSWKELKPGDEEDKEQPDEVKKVHDDGLDALGSWAMGWMSGYVPKEAPELPADITDLQAFPLGQVFDLEEYVDRMLKERWIANSN